MLTRKAQPRPNACDPHAVFVTWAFEASNGWPVRVVELVDLDRVGLDALDPFQPLFESGRFDSAWKLLAPLG